MSHMTQRARLRRESFIDDPVRGSLALDADLVIHVPIASAHGEALGSNEKPGAPLLHRRVLEYRAVRHRPALRQKLAAPRLERAPLESDTVILILYAQMHDGTVAIKIIEIGTS